MTFTVYTDCVATLNEPKYSGSKMLATKPALLDETKPTGRDNVQSVHVRNWAFMWLLCFIRHLYIWMGYGKGCSFWTPKKHVSQQMNSTQIYTRRRRSQLNHVEPTIDLSHGPELTLCSQQEVSIGSWQYINQESESVSSTNTFQRQTVETPETSITSKNTYRIAILP